MPLTHRLNSTAAIRIWIPWNGGRVLEECADIAYAKLIIKTSGFITKEWYPFFYTVRREGETLQDAYEDGKISRVGKRIYDIVSDGHVALHEIKTLSQFRKEDKVNFDRAMIEIQMGMYTTMTGRKRKRNRFGEEYGWNSTVFTTVENFWSERGYSIPELNATDCYVKIRQQILRLKPTWDQRTIRKFITGS